VRTRPKGPSRYGTVESRSETPIDREILTLTQAAALLQIHPITLCTWRRECKGPPALKLAGSARAVRFLRRDVLKWAANSRAIPGAVHK
jgi:helix-turn-helix protein